MAITVAARGSGGTSTDGTSIAFSPASNFASNSFAVLLIGESRLSTPPEPSITDTDGNSWIKRLDVYDATGDIGIIIATCSSQSLTTADTITIDWGSTMSVMIYHLYEVASDISTISFVDTNSASSNSNGTITTSSMVSGEVVFGLIGRKSIIEATPDSDTLNGSWSSQVAVQASDGNLAFSSQYKVVTGNGAQTYNITTGVRNTIAYLHLNEASSSLDPFGWFGIFGI